jgi:hypothetical protein
MAIRNPLKVRYASLILAGILLSACGTGSLTGEVGDGRNGGGGYVIPGGDIAGDWDIQVVDDNGNVGKLNELRFNGQGQPSIAYFAVSGTVYWIRYAAYDGWTWEIETVHETDTMTGCGLTMDPTGSPVLTYVGGERTPLYYWPFQSDLLMANWTGADWATEAVDEEGVVGLWPSVAFDRFGLAGISYQDLGTGIDYNDFHLRDLKYAYSTGGSWTTETVDLDGGGYYTNLLFDEDDQPGIAYCGNMDDDRQSVKFAHRGDFGWEIHTVDTFAECAEGSLSARSTPGGGFGIAYYDEGFEDLRYAAYMSGIWVRETVESHNQVGKYCSLAYGPDGQPVISYYYCGRSTDDDCQGGGDLRVAQRTQTGWETVTVETEGNTGLFTSIEVSNTGTIYVSYYDQSQQSLKMAIHR